MYLPRNSRFAANNLNSIFDDTTVYRANFNLLTFHIFTKRSRLMCLSVFASCLCVYVRMENWIFICPFFLSRFLNTIANSTRFMDRESHLRFLLNSKHSTQFHVNACHTFLPMVRYHSHSPIFSLSPFLEIHLFGRTFATQNRNQIDKYLLIESRIENIYIHKLLVSFTFGSLFTLGLTNAFKHFNLAAECLRLTLFLNHVCVSCYSSHSHFSHVKWLRVRQALVRICTLHSGVEINCSATIKLFPIMNLLVDWNHAATIKISYFHSVLAYLFLYVYFYSRLQVIHWCCHCYSY